MADKISLKSALSRGSTKRKPKSNSLSSSSDSLPIRTHSKSASLSNSSAETFFRQLHNPDEAISNSTITSDKILFQKPTEPLTPQQLEKMNKTRVHVLNEILNSERDYVRDCNTIIQIYKSRLISLGLITGEQQKTIFGNIEFLEEINRIKVLAPMEVRFANAKENSEEIFTICLGDLFMSLSEDLKSYIDYCANQPLALAMLDTLKTLPEFVQFDQNTMDTYPEVRNLPMLSYIIKPVQRLCKYPLLLRELIANTNHEDPEYSKLVVAATKVNNTVELVNEMQKEAEARTAEKQLQIQKLSSEIKGVEGLNLAGDKNRELVREGPGELCKKSKREPCHMFLFNNLLLITTPKSAGLLQKRKSIGSLGKRDALSASSGDVTEAKDTIKEKEEKKRHFAKLLWYVEISTLMVTNLADEPSGHGTNGILIKNKANPDEENYIVATTTLQEKEAWIAQFKYYIKEYQKKQNKKLQVTGGGVAQTVKAQNTSDLTSARYNLSTPVPQLLAYIRELEEELKVAKQTIQQLQSSQQTQQPQQPQQPQPTSTWVAHRPSPIKRENLVVIDLKESEPSVPDL